VIFFPVTHAHTHLTHTYTHTQHENHLCKSEACSSVSSFSRSVSRALTALCTARRGAVKRSWPTATRCAMSESKNDAKSVRISMTIQHDHSAYCNTLQHTATHCSTLHHTAPHRTTPHHTASHRNTPEHIATHRNTPQHTATHRNTPQHTATHDT